MLLERKKGTLRVEAAFETSMSDLVFRRIARNPDDVPGRGNPVSPLAE
jgi:hypothetical protein